MLEVIDLNPFVQDFNLDSRKFARTVGFEEKEETKAIDSNPRKKDSISLKNFQIQVKKEKKLNSNLGIWRYEEHMKDLNPYKKDSNPIYRMKLLAENQAERFESPLLQMHLMLGQND